MSPPGRPAQHQAWRREGLGPAPRERRQAARRGRSSGQPVLESRRLAEDGRAIGNRHRQDRIDPGVPSKKSAREREAMAPHAILWGGVAAPERRDRAEVRPQERQQFCRRQSGMAAAHWPP